MIQKIISLSVNNKFIVILGVTGLLTWGIYSILNIPIDAVPDITNNQAQIITTSRNLSTQDVEQFITYPIELEMANLPGVKEIRSVSKFGLSVVTVVFDDDLGTYLPRQLINERLNVARENIPTGFGTPFIGPITTGLGEIYQYTLEVDNEHKHQYTTMDLRTIQDWVVRRQLSGIPGVVEINTWGGQLKQYEVAIDPIRMNSLNISVQEVFTALENNNSIGGGGYIEKENQAYFIRGEGLITSIDDIENVVIRHNGHVPVRIKDVANVDYAPALRFGAITGNGEGEKVMGQIMLLKNASTSSTIELVKERVTEIQKTLPEGVYINPFLERSELISKTSFTVAENLILGAVIVIVVVILLLGDVRAGLLISSVIPLCLLFAVSLMKTFGISANLMSLGAVDFGIIIDGAIIIVEFVLYSLITKTNLLQTQSASEAKKQKDEVVIQSAGKMMRSAIFGQLIILIVFVPILVLDGVEGKMFRPMALTFSFALVGAMILCLTYVPVMASIFIRGHSTKKTLSDRLMEWLGRLYDPVIRLALRFRKSVVALSLIWLGGSFFLFTTMGGEFIPTLDEGDLVIQPIIPAGTSLSETIRLTTKMEQILKDNFTEVEQVVSRIGAAEIPTDPMSMEEPDVIVKLKPKSEWVNAETKDELIEKMHEKLSQIVGIEYEFTQPIEMRFNELITGVRADLAIKIFGHDLEVLAQKANEVKSLISGVQGAEDISVEKTEGLPQMLIQYDRNKIAQYDLNISELNNLIQIAFGGKKTGEIFEEDRRFDLVVRLNKESRQNLSSLENLMIDLPDGHKIPLGEVAKISEAKGPAKISRDNTHRRIVIGVNVRNRDLQSVVEEIQQILDEKLTLPEGFSIEYGGQFENLNHAKQRLLIAVPFALALIFILLYFTFNSFREALLVYAAIPLAATGGIVLLWLRDMPFSISAGVGFIALFGIAVLNGIVLIEHFNELRHHAPKNFKAMIITATKQRIRPVLLTASAAALGFLPMALSHSAGAEVQRPLATVVIGGLISSTLLTLVVLPVLFYLATIKEELRIKKSRNHAVLALMALFTFSGYSQETRTIDEIVSMGIQNNPAVKISDLKIAQTNYLNKASYQSDKLGVTFGYGQINASSNDYQINVNQQFYFPTVYTSRSQLNQYRETVSLAEKEITLNELEFEIRSTCYQVIYLSKLNSSLQELYDYFANFEKAARVRYETGDGTLLEWSQAKAKTGELSRLLTSNKTLYSAYIQSLQLIVGSETQILPDTTSQDRVMLPKADTADLGSNPTLAYYQSLIDQSEKEIKLARSGYLPDISLGYTNQQIEGVSGLSSYSLGLRIPLFVNEKKAEVQSAQINREILTEQADLFELKLQKELLELFSQYNQYSLTLTYYENEGLSLADVILSTATESYQTGDADYLEWISAVENSMQIRQNYLHTLNSCNQISLRINYLTGIK